MADQQKVKVFDGTNWVGIEPEEATLPISDAAATVKIWSAAAGYINFDTDNKTQFRMDPSGGFRTDGRVMSRATGSSNVSFGNESGNDGFTIVSGGLPGIVSNGELIQNYKYQVMAANETNGDVYERYQSTVKARKGPTSYSELMFLSDDPENKGLRFLACGSGVRSVLGVTEFDTSGVSALLHNGYLIEGSSPATYTSFVIGSQASSDIVLFTGGTGFVTLDASTRTVKFGVKIEEATVKNNLIVEGQIQTDTITSKDDASGDPVIELSDQVTLKTVDGSVYDPIDGASLVTKSWVIANASGESYNDTQIFADLQTETDARINADVVLQGNIGVESNTRALADEALTAVDVGLQNQIDNLAPSGGVTSGTPATPISPMAAAGSMMFDENYLWLKTSSEWKKIPLAGFAAPAATATVQLSESQYQALSPKDPNTLYIIVG